MKKQRIIKSLVTALALALGTGAAQAEDQRYIIKFKDGQGNSVKAALKAKGGKVKKSLEHRNLVAATLPAQALNGLRNNPNVELLEIDPRRKLMAESTPFGIGMVQADIVSDQFISNRKVCIVDTGYDLGHEDLIDAGVTGDDGYGSNDTGNWYNDGHGHGTHVAGTISAIGGNNTGVVGVTGSGQLQLHIVKVFNDSGSWAYGSDLVAAVDQCVTAGANVISMSLGGSGSSSAEQNAFDQALANGVLSIAAAGNDGNSSMSFPASYDSVVSVGAVDSNKNIASFSQYNSQVEIAAPGVAVMSTLPGNTYDAWSGTSMATPHVSGVAALVWSHHTACTASEIRNALNVTAEDRGSAGRDDFYGHGIVLAKAAIDAITADGCDLGGVTPPPPPPPVVTELENGVPVTGLAGGTGEEQNFTLDVPAGATDISFTMSGGTGDADLYVKFGSAPTTSSYDCRPYASGNNETCTGADTDGTYYVMIKAYSSFSGVSLVGSYTDAGNPPPPGAIDLSANKRQKRNRGFVDLTWDGATTSTVDIYRNGVLKTTTDNDGAWTDNIGKRPSGSFTYKVCDQGTNNCSNEVTVSF